MTLNVFCALKEPLLIALKMLQLYSYSFRGLHRRLHHPVLSHSTFTSHSHPPNAGMRVITRPIFMVLINPK